MTKVWVPVDLPAGYEVTCVMATAGNRLSGEVRFLSIIGSCEVDFSSPLSKEPPAMPCTKPTRIDAYRTSDGEVFFDEAEAINHEATKSIENRIRLLYDDLATGGSLHIFGTNLIAWFRRNASEIECIAARIIDN